MYKYVQIPDKSDKPIQIKGSKTSETVKHFNNVWFSNERPKTRKHHRGEEKDEMNYYFSFFWTAITLQQTSLLAWSELKPVNL